MGAKDAEMPDHVALREEVQKIAKHLATLRQDVEALTGSIRSAGDHQLHRAQDKASEALGKRRGSRQARSLDLARHRCRDRPPARHRDRALAAGVVSVRLPHAERT